MTTVTSTAHTSVRLGPDIVLSPGRNDGVEKPAFDAWMKANEGSELAACFTVEVEYAAQVKSKAEDPPATKLAGAGSAKVKAKAEAT